MSAKAAAHGKAGGKGHGRRGGHEEEHEEHVNHERWLVTYADMLTLLMVLFIVLFAMSQVDAKKFAELKTGLASGFGAPVTMLSGADKLLGLGDSAAKNMVSVKGVAAANTSSGTNDPAVDPKQVAALVKELNKGAAQQEAAKLTQAEKALKQALKDAGQSQAVKFGYTPDGLVLTIVTDKVLYGSGSAGLMAQGKTILSALCPTLKALPNNISVNGHTNSIPIHTAQFPSNWELSSDRANGVVRFLISACSMSPERMRSAGFADTVPLVTPTNSAEALVRNRRVEIVILANLDKSQGQALQEAGQNAETSAANAGADAGVLTPDGTTAPSSSPTASNASSSPSTGTSSP